MNFNPETIKKILRNKKRLEIKLKLKIDIKDSSVELFGDELDIFVGEKVLEALERNFPVSIALLLIDKLYILEDIPIKSISKKNLGKIKARIIGTKGKTLKVLSELSSCYITLHENTVSIIGKAETIKEAVTAIERLIKGSRQANVYKYLEKSKEREFPEDLGIKEKDKF